MITFLAKYWWLVAVIVYVTAAVALGVYLHHTGAERPIIGGLLWPIRLVKMLLGGG
jgi:hypothetical protein